MQDKGSQSPPTRWEKGGGNMRRWKIIGVLLFAFVFRFAYGSVSVSVSNLTIENQGIIPGSGATAILGLNMTATGVQEGNSTVYERLRYIRVRFTNLNPNKPLNLNRDIKEVAIYKDNGPYEGSFDTGDSPIASVSNLPDYEITIPTPIPNEKIDDIPRDDTGAYAGNDYYIVIKTTDTLATGYDNDPGTDYRVKFRVEVRAVGWITDSRSTWGEVAPPANSTNTIIAEARVVDLIPYRSDHLYGIPDLEQFIGVHLKEVNTYPRINTLIRRIINIPFIGHYDVNAPLSPKYFYGQFYLFRAYFQDHDLNMYTTNLDFSTNQLTDDNGNVYELMGMCIPYRVLGIDVAGRSTYAEDDNEYLKKVVIVIEDTSVKNFDAQQDLASHPLSPYPNVSLWYDVDHNGFFDPSVDRLIPASNAGPIGPHVEVHKIPNKTKWWVELDFDDFRLPIDKTADGKVDFFICIATEPSHGYVTNRPFYGADFKVYINGNDSEINDGILIDRQYKRTGDGPDQNMYTFPQFNRDKNHVKEAKVVLDIKPIDGRDGPIEADGVPIPIFMINMTDSWGQFANDEKLQWIRVWFKQEGTDNGDNRYFKPTDLMPLSDDENSGVSLWLDDKTGLKGLPDSRNISESDMQRGLHRVTITDKFIPLDASSLEWYNSDGTKWSPSNDDPQNPEGHKRYFVILKPKYPIDLYDDDYIDDNSPSGSSGSDYPGKYGHYGYDVFICIKPRGISVPETAYKSNNWKDRGIDYGKKVYAAIGLTNDPSDPNRDPHVHIYNPNDPNGYHHSYEDILFSHGFNARLKFPIESETKPATVPTFFTNLTSKDQTLSPYKEKSVIGINLVAPPGKNISFDSMTILIIDDNNPPTLAFDELVEPNSDPNDPNSGCGIALYKDTNRNGIFDPDDKRVYMKKRPYLLPQAGDDPVGNWSQVFRVRLEFEDPPPGRNDCVGVGNIPNDDYGENCGPDYFLVIKPNSNIDPEDRFHVLLWGSDECNETTIHFTGDASGITYKRVRTDVLSSSAQTMTIYDDRTYEGMKIDILSDPIGVIGLNIYDVSGKNNLIGGRIYFDPINEGLTPSKVLAPLNNNNQSGLSIWRDNGDGIFNSATDTFLSMAFTGWRSDYVEGFVSGKHTQIPSGTLLNSFNYDENIYWFDWDGNGIWSDYDCLWKDVNGDGIYNDGDIFIAGIEWTGYPGVLIHDYVYGFAFYSNFLKNTPEWSANKSYKVGEYVKPTTPSTWSKNKNYSVGDRVLPTKKNGFYYRCTKAGISGNIEPEWPIIEGKEIKDGGVIWQAIPLNKYVYKCKTAGTSGNTEPDWNPYGGDISDGSVTWKVELVKFLPDFPDWSSGTVYKEGEVIKPNSATNKNLVYRCIAAGTSGGSEPVWPTNEGDEIDDNGVKWKAESYLQNDIYYIGRGRNRLGYFTEIYLNQPVRLPNNDNDRGDDFFVVIRTGDGIEYLDSFSISIPSNSLLFSNSNSFANVDITTNRITGKISVKINDLVVPGATQIVSGEVKPIYSLEIYDSNTDIKNYIYEVNVYFSGENPVGDLAPLSRSNTSGVLFYKDSNNDGVWQSTDQFISPASIYWINGNRVRMIFNNLEVPDTPGQYFFIVIQANSSVNVGNTLKAEIRSEFSSPAGDGFIFKREDGKIEKSGVYYQNQRQITFTQPILNINPTSLNFGGVTTTLNVNIRNTGGGILSWNIGTPTYYQGTGWISIIPTSGTTLTETDTITITVDRTGLSTGNYNAQIPVYSNGGIGYIDVSMDVLGPKISVSTNFIDFGTTDTLKTFDIKNTGAGILHWNITITYTSGSGWLTVDPMSGDTQTEMDTVNLTVNRSGLNPGNYSATVSIDSDGGTERVNVIMEVSGPKFAVEPDNLNFGDSLTTLSFKVKNIGAGQFNWSIDPNNIVYQQQGATGWITQITPLSGTVSVDNPSTVSVTIRRTGLSQGGYSAIIPVKRDDTGEIKNVLVSMSVSIPLKFKISAGAFHSLAIKSDGTLWAWGRNDSGQVGDGTNNNVLTPKMITGYNDWVKVSAGYSHSVGIRSNGTLWAWGKNSYGQLGDGTTIDRNVPVQIGTDTDWVDVACGADYTLALKSDGTLWAWGRNNYGQLGDGTTTDRLTPTKIGTSKAWVKISAGWDHSLAIKSDGSLWAWGNNSYGQLGIGNKTNINIPVQVGWDRDWSDVKAGWNHSIGIKTDGSLWAWGSNILGQIGDGTTTDRTSPVLISPSGWSYACGGSNYTIGVKTEGTLWGWGNNSFGQLGDGTYDDKKIPSQIGTDNQWLGVACGASHTIAVKKDGTLWTWGSNSFGQLGNGTTSSTNMPQNIGSGFVMTRSFGNHIVALSSDGSLYAWGSNDSGQLGTGNYENSNTPVKVGNDNDWMFVSAGYSHTVGIKKDGTLWAWGKNDGGQLGTGNYENSNIPTKVGNDNDWMFVSAGYSHTVGIKKDGTLWAWGKNDSGQLGTGNYKNSNIPTKVGNDNDWMFVSAGYSHTVGIKKDGTLWAWGSNWYGQLGTGNTIDYPYPVKIGNDNDWIFVSAGYSHTIGLKRDGTLWAWGSNWYGQLGINSLKESLVPVRIPLSEEWISVATGYTHTVGITKNGNLWVWGSSQSASGTSKPILTGGDLNKDGIVDISDVILCLRRSIGIDISDEITGDVNWDGIVDISDVILILRSIIENY
jgi:alpha-tubulin suppressor-like RCC1 family protein